MVGQWDVLRWKDDGQLFPLLPSVLAGSEELAMGMSSDHWKTENLSTWGTAVNNWWSLTQQGLVCPLAHALSAQIHQKRVESLTFFWIHTHSEKHILSLLLFFNPTTESTASETSVLHLWDHRAALCSSPEHLHCCPAVCWAVWRNGLG